MRSATSGSGGTDSAVTDRLFGPLLVALSTLDESQAVELALTPVAECLAGFPGVRDVELGLAPAEDSGGAWPAPETGVVIRTAGRAQAESDGPVHKIPLRAGRSLYGWLRLHTDPGQTLAPYARELEAVARLVALHLERRQTLSYLDRANRDVVEAHQTLERQVLRSAEREAGIAASDVLAAVADAQARFLADAPVGDALGLLLDRLVALTGSRAGFVAERASVGAGAEPALRLVHPAAASVPDLDRLADTVLRRNEAVTEPGPAGMLFAMPVGSGGTTVAVLGLIGGPDGVAGTLDTDLAPAAAAVAALLDAGRAREERHQAKRELRRRIRRAELANLAKTEFLANMSHELRTPLNAIMGFAELLKTEAFGPLGSDRYVGYAGDIYDSGALLLQIINDILDVAKIETGRTVLQPDWVDAGRLVAGVARLIHPRAKGASITLETSVPPDGLPRLWADERLLKQALLNVLSNAVKFTPAGGHVRFAVSAEPGALCFEVTDTGEGIAESELTKVFQPFHRGESAMNRRYEGTGLGLPLARSFVELHGGSLTLDSEKGRGTTVRIRIPCGES